MSADSRKSISWASLLILFGLLAPFAGEKSLVVLIPAAMLVWYGYRPAPKARRN